MRHVRWHILVLHAVCALMLATGGAAGQYAQTSQYLATDGLLDTAPPTPDLWADLAWLRLEETPGAWRLELATHGPGQDPAGAGDASTALLRWHLENRTHRLLVQVGDAVEATLDDAPVAVEAEGAAGRWTATFGLDALRPAAPPPGTAVQAWAWANASEPAPARDVMVGPPVSLTGGIAFPAWGPAHAGPSPGSSPDVAWTGAGPIVAYINGTLGEDAAVETTVQGRAEALPIRPVGPGLDLDAAAEQAAVTYAGEAGPIVAWLDARAPGAPRVETPMADQPMPRAPTGAGGSIAVGDPTWLAVPTSGQSVTLLGGNGTAWWVETVVAPAVQPTVARAPDGSWWLAYFEPSPSGASGAVVLLAPDGIPFRVATGVRSPIDADRPAPFAFALRADGVAGLAWDDGTVRFALLQHGRLEAEDTPLPPADAVSLAFDAFGDAVVATAAYRPGDALTAPSWTSGLHMRTVHGHWFQVPGHAPGKAPAVAVAANGTAAAAGVDAGPVWRAQAGTPVHDGFAAPLTVSGGPPADPAPATGPGATPEEGTSRDTPAPLAAALAGLCAAAWVGGLRNRR